MYYQDEDWESNPHQGQASSNEPAQFYQPSRSYDQPRDNRRYGQQSREYPNAEYGNSNRNRNRSDDNPNTWRNNDSGEGRPRFNRDNRSRGYGDGDGGATFMKIPTRFVGKVIGRGGSKINELQSESGARINVTRDTEGDETIVKISGGEAEINKAKDLISEVAKDTIRFD